MRSFWVTFYNHFPGTVDAETLTDAYKEAAVFGKVMEAQVLPHPASPRLVVKAETIINCYRPNQCKGFTSCRKDPACSE